MSQVVCIFGRRGSGKSTLARSLVAGCTRLIVFNTLGEAEHNDLGLVFTEPQKLFDYVSRSVQFRAVADFQDDTLFPWTVKLAEAVENCTLMVDELDRHANPRQIPPELDNCVRYGRHWGVSLLAISRRPAEIPRIVTSQAEVIHTFRLNEPRDVQYVRQFVGDEAFTDLGEHEHLSYNV